MNYYFSIGDIQNRLDEYFQKESKKADFPFVIRELFTENKYITLTSELPDISKLALLDEEHFAKSLNQLYIKLNEKIIMDERLFNVIEDNNVMAVTNIFSNTKESSHLHDCFEIDYVFEGGVELTFLDEHRHLNKGDLCILSPFTKHMTVTSGENSMVFSILVKETTFKENFYPLLNNNDIISQFFNNILSTPEKPNYLLFNTEENKEISQIMQRIFIENFRYDKYVLQSCINLLNLLFITILRETNTYHQFSSYKFGPDYAPILRYIQTHYQTVTLPILSSKFNYTPPYLSKIIKEATGSTFEIIVQNLRIAEAKKLLSETDMSVERIAFKVGYNSADHFYRVFKKNQGISPLQFRKKSST